MAYVDQTIFDNYLVSAVYVGYTAALCGNCYSFSTLARLIIGMIAFAPRMVFPFYGDYTYRVLYNIVCATGG